MRKKNILILFIVLMFAFIVYPMKVALVSAELVLEDLAITEPLKQASQDPIEIVIKTYHLKFIRPIEILNAAKFYIIDSTATQDTITVQIMRKNIPKLEELLKKLDVEKKTVLFRVFTVVASKEEDPKGNKTIENKELRKVIDELNSLWNFKSYKVDGPSFLTVKEDSGANSFRLVSDVSYFYMNILHVKVRGEKSGTRLISVGQVQLNWRINLSEETEQTLIDTHNITLKENGYLVAGISGFGWIGKGAKALILVINAEIK